MASTVLSSVAKYLVSLTKDLDPHVGAYLSAGICSAISFIGVVTLGLLRIKTIDGPIEYLSLCFAGTALIADALMHLLPEAYGVHSHDSPGMTPGAHSHGHAHKGPPGSSILPSFLSSVDTSSPMYVGAMATCGGLLLIIVEVLSSCCGTHICSQRDSFFEDDISDADSRKSGQEACNQTNQKEAVVRDQSPTGASKKKKSLEIKSFGVSNLVVEFLHNFVDGIAIGLAWTSGSAVSAVSGINTTLAIIAHEIPQELGDFMVLRLAGFPTGILLFWNFLVSLSTILGVYVSCHLDSHASREMKMSFVALTGGSFLSLGFHQILPQVQASVERHHRKNRFASRLAIASCLLVSLLSLGIVYEIGFLEEASHNHGDDHGHSHDHSHEHSHGHSHGHDHSQSKSEMREAAKKQRGSAHGDGDDSAVCPQVYQPVCDTVAHKTYSNKCVAVSQNGVPALNLHQGSCDQQEL